MGAQTAAEKIVAIRIDKTSPTPVYAQIAEALRALLASGAAPVGTPLPPERVLCEQFSVSRMTLRQAYDILERDGLLESHRGRGTFVAPIKMQKKQQEMRSFTEEIRARGGIPSSQLLAFRTVKQHGAAKDFFGLPESELLFEIERVRFADGVPLALELIHIPQYLCPNLDRFDLVSQSLYRLMEENYGLDLARCTEEISASHPTKSQRTLLQIPPAVAVLTVKRRTYSDKETPVELAITTFRGDLYTAIVHSRRSSK